MLELLRCPVGDSSKTVPRVRWALLMSSSNLSASLWISLSTKGKYKVSLLMKNEQKKLSKQTEINQTCYQSKRLEKTQQNFFLNRTELPRTELTPTSALPCSLIVPSMARKPLGKFIFALIFRKISIREMVEDTDPRNTSPSSL